MSSPVKISPDDGDQQLIQAWKAGDELAFGHLYARHYAAAHHFAASLGGANLADDLVSSAFERVMAAVRRGRGPEHAFRAYLKTTIRAAHVDHLRRSGRELPSGDRDYFNNEPARPVATDSSDTSDTLQRAFVKLPDRWQTILYHSAVNGEPLQLVARRLGIGTNAAAALNLRAREGLREAYLAEHVRSVTSIECRAVLKLMPRYVRDRLGRRQRVLVEAHLDSCPSCPLVAVNLRAISSKFPVAAPIAALAAAGAEHASRLESAKANFGKIAPSKSWAALSGVFVATALVGTAYVYFGGMHNPGPGIAEFLKIAPPGAANHTNPENLGRRHRVDPPTQESSDSADSGSSISGALPASRLRLGQLSVSPIGRDLTWQHVELPIDAAEGEVTLTITGSSLQGFHVHHEPPHLDWACTSSPTPRRTVAGQIEFRLTCSHTFHGELAKAPFAVDLNRSGAAPTRLTIAFPGMRQRIIDVPTS